MTNFTIDVIPYREIIPIEHHRHQAHEIKVVLVGTNWRCTFCGHRVTVNGVAPVATRELPPTRWLPELIDRRRAMARFAWREEEWTRSTSIS